MLKLMYITKYPEIAQIAEEAGVDWIFVDMEFIGKDCRQGGLDTVQNHHTVEDVAIVKAAVRNAKVLVRVNPIHEVYSNYLSSKEEIDAVIKVGADIIMLPYFKTIEEVEVFIKYVDNRAKTCLLVETPEAAYLLEKIVEISGIDMIHIGLNDMHLAMRMKFMFQLLYDGSVDKWARVIKSKGSMFGFGGVASLDGGVIPGRMILKEHYRLGSQMVIVSRSFCNVDKIGDLGEIRTIFRKGIQDIRMLEIECQHQSDDYFDNNRIVTNKIIEEFVKVI